MADWVPQFLGFAFILVYVFVRYFADEALSFSLIVIYTLK
jgi:hypothetical protein